MKVHLGQRRNKVVTTGDNVIRSLRGIVKKKRKKKNQILLAEPVFK